MTPTTRTLVVLGLVLWFLLWFKTRKTVVSNQKLSKPSQAAVQAATKPPTSVDGYGFGPLQYGMDAAAEVAAATGYTPPAQGSTSLPLTGNSGDAENTHDATLDAFTPPGAPSAMPYLM